MSVLLQLMKFAGIQKLSVVNSDQSLTINYRVYPSNKQKQNWKIDTSLVAIGAQTLFFSLYNLGVKGACNKKWWR